jgi:hypothetical protein
VVDNLPEFPELLQFPNPLSTLRSEDCPEVELDGDVVVASGLRQHVVEIPVAGEGLAEHVYALLLDGKAVHAVAPTPDDNQGVIRSIISDRSRRSRGVLSDDFGGVDYVDVERGLEPLERRDCPVAKAAVCGVAPTPANNNPIEPVVCGGSCEPGSRRRTVWVRLNRLIHTSGFDWR